MRHLTYKQIAEYTGLKQQRLYDLQKHGQLPRPVKKIGIKQLFDAQEIKDWWAIYRTSGNRSQKKLRDVDIPVDGARIELEDMWIDKQNERLKRLEAQADTLERLLREAIEKLGDSAAGAMVAKDGFTRPVEAYARLLRQVAEEVGDVDEGQEYVLRIAGVDEEKI